MSPPNADTVAPWADGPVPPASRRDTFLTGATWALFCSALAYGAAVILVWAAPGDGPALFFAILYLTPLLLFMPLMGWMYLPSDQMAVFCGLLALAWLASLLNDDTPLPLQARQALRMAGFGAAVLGYMLAALLIAQSIQGH